ncbi:MAG: DinB family protein, partial [Gemmatimonadota bacterium]
MKSPALLFGFLLLAGSAHAQTTTANPAVNTSRQLWEQLTGYITTAAQDTPESLYAYRPTPQVRSFGQLIGHLAGSQYMFCATALGDSTRAEDAIEKTTTSKTDLVAALKASTEYCARAYAQT